VLPRVRYGIGNYPFWRGGGGGRKKMKQNENEIYFEMNVLRYSHLRIAALECGPTS
jgi:hypothetical protein